MASLNLCQFIGNVGKIEQRYLSNGDAVVNLSLAANESWKDKSGDKQEKTEWINVTIYGKLAEITGEYVTKGKQIYIAGRMATRKWTHKDGTDRYTTEIIANDMKMLGSRPSVDQESNHQANSSSPSQSQNSGGFENMEDDIPF